jgi:hypothetical protein
MPFNLSDADTCETLEISRPPFESQIQLESDLGPHSGLELGEFLGRRGDQLRDDYGNFYGPRNLANLTAGFLVGGMMANTNVDTYVGETVFENMIDVNTDEYTEIFHAPKSLGDGYLVLPLIGVTALAEPWLEQSRIGKPIGEWGNRSMRAALVGGPFVLAAQSIIGGSRPNESTSQSHWEPFQDNNGVSGHSFVGAVPFLARPTSSLAVTQVACYAGSILPGFSRINDERHYFSQVFLGWYVAFLATHAVNQTQTGGDGFQLYPTFDQDGFGLILDKRF